MGLMLNSSRVDMHENLAERGEDRCQDVTLTLYLYLSLLLLFLFFPFDPLEVNGLIRF